MKYLFLIPIVILFFSCNKEENNIRILHANIDGDSIFFDKGLAQQYNDISKDQSVRYRYVIFNHALPGIFITVLDSTFNKQNFSFPAVTAKYVYSESLENSKNYSSVAGNFKIIKKSDDILQGEFDFTMVNNRNDSDTLKIGSGYFEISLEKYNSYIGN